MKNIPINNGTIQRLKYGSATPLYFTPVDNSYQRIDLYISLDGEKFEENYLCTGLNDLSPIYKGVYNSECSACWLHYGHTENKHNISLKIK